MYSMFYTVGIFVICTYKIQNNILSNILKNIFKLKDPDVVDLSKI